MTWQWFHRLGSPKWFFNKTTRWVVWLGYISILMLAVGLVWGMAIAPPHFEQGNSYRIIYLHVPAAILAMAGYCAMAVTAAVGFIWHIKLSFWMMRSAAVIGAVLTAIALITGSIWGKITWGAWWVWDARMFTVVILQLLYLGVIALQGAYTNRDLANKVCAILVLVGVVNIPIIYKSVDWWFSVHQTATLKAKPSFTGLDKLSYTIENDKGEQSSANVYIYVDQEGKAIERPETAPGQLAAVDDGPYYVKSGGVLTGLDILANDVNPAGGDLRILGDPVSEHNGIAVMVADGTLTYAPWTSHIHPAMLYPLLFMTITFYVIFTWLLLLWTRVEILRQESRKQWVKDWVREQMQSKSSTERVH